MLPDLIKLFQRDLDTRTVSFCCTYSLIFLTTWARSTTSDGSTNRKRKKPLSYSDRSDFTGFAVAALIDSKLTVSQAMTRAERNATAKIVQSMAT